MKLRTNLLRGLAAGLAILPIAMAVGQERSEPRERSGMQRSPNLILCMAPLGMMKIELGLSPVQVEKVGQIQANVQTQLKGLRRAGAGEEGVRNTDGERHEGEGRPSPALALVAQAGSQIAELLTDKQKLAAQSLGSHVESFAFTGIPIEVYDRLGLSPQQESRLVQIGWQARSSLKGEDPGEQMRRAARKQAEAAAAPVLTPQQIAIINQFRAQPPHEGG